MAKDTFISWLLPIHAQNSEDLQRECPLNGLLQRTARGRLHSWFEESPWAPVDIVEILIMVCF